MMMLSSLALLTFEVCVDIVDMNHSQVERMIDLVFGWEAIHRYGEKHKYRQVFEKNHFVFFAKHRTNTD